MIGDCGLRVGEVLDVEPQHISRMTDGRHYELEVVGGKGTTDESVVLVPTGTGFKEMGTGEAEVAAETVRREDLPDRLESLLAP